MAVKITQLGDTATPGRRLGSFAGRSPSGGRTVGKIIQLALSAVSGRRYGSFSGRSSGGGSTGGFSRAQAVNNTMEPLKLSTARNLMVFLADSADHITGKTGLTLTITASKDGAAFASVTPTVTERGNGWYNLALTSSHTDTLGDFAVHITGAGADPCDFKLPVEVERTGAVASMAAGVISAATFAANALDAVWSTAARVLTAGTNIVLAKGTGVTGFNDIAAGAAMTLTSGERTSIADAHLDRADAIEVGLTPRQAHRLEAAAAAGKLSGAATPTATIRNAVADSKDRIIATVDANGNRIAVSTDVTP